MALELFSALKSRFRNLWEGKSLAAPEPWLVDLLGATPGASGVAVTPHKAMTCPPVRCAVQSIAETVGQLPVIAYKRDGDKKDRAREHPVYRLLHDQANEWQGAREFREQLTRDALLWDGGGFAYINRVDERPYELIRLTPGTVSVEIADDGGPIYKARQSNGTTRVYSREDIFHIRAAYVDGFGGASPTTLAREAIGLALTMEAHAARLFGNSARPSGVLTLEDVKTAEALKLAKAAWDATHGNGNSGKTAVIPGKGNWQQLTLNSVDSQFLELRTFATCEIARAYRVPPPMLMELGRATFHNTEQMGQQFLTFGLAPWLCRWQDEIQLKLFSPEERPHYFAEFLVDDLLKADTAARYEAYSKAIAARILNPNEVRAMDNRAPYAGGDQFLNPNTTANAGAADG